MPQAPCPYCGHLPESPGASRCSNCGGLFEPLSRKATQLAMGAWFVRDEARPFMPGFNDAILRHQVASGRVKADTIVRGPTTHQFWMRADQTPGVSRLLGKCHACGGGVSPEDQTCKTCHADLSLPTDIDRLGLMFTDAEARHAAQAEVQAQRVAPPPKPAQPRPEATVVDPDLLEPVEDQTHDEAHDADDQAYDDSAGPSAADIAEDLWQHDAPVAATRRRAKRSGPEPAVLALGVLLLCIVAAGVFLALTKGKGLGLGDDQADTNSPAGPDAPEAPKYTPRQVEQLANQVRAQAEAYDADAVPEPFRDRLSEITKLIALAEADNTNAQYTPAYERYEKAKQLLVGLPAEIEAWENQQALKMEAVRLVSDVELLRQEAKAEALEAPRFAPAALSAGDAAWSLAQDMLAKEAYEQAPEKLNEAAQAYQRAIDKAKAGQAALLAQAELIKAMSAAPSQQTLSQIAPAQLDRLMKKQDEGVMKFNAGEFAEAERAFIEASAAVASAMQAVELAKYRKVYSYHAGYEAAGVLMAIASGDAVQDDALKSLKQRYDALALPDNPANALKPGNATDYADAAEYLVNAARDAINTKHGGEVQACYNAGFQARIIEQTLATNALTNDQQQRVHQSLKELQDQAAAAGWDLGQFRAVLEVVRSANRGAKIGQPPVQTRSAFEVLMQPLRQRDTAARLMDPVLAPSTPQDPELFPGLGSSGP